MNRGLAARRAFLVVGLEAFVARRTQVVVRFGRRCRSLLELLDLPPEFVEETHESLHGGGPRAKALVATPSVGTDAVDRCVLDTGLFVGEVALGVVAPEVAGGGECAESGGAPADVDVVAALAAVGEMFLAFA